MTRSLTQQDQKGLQIALESLTAREAIYVDSRCGGTPPFTAAKVAGYSDPSTKSKQLETDSRIRMAVEYTLRCRTHEYEYTRDDILQGFRDAIGCAASAMEMIAGWREIAKLTGAYAPTQVDVQHTHRKEEIGAMSDNDLAALAAGSNGEEPIEGDFYEVLEFTEDEG